MRATIFVLTIGIAATATARPAAADGYFEGVVGLAVPVADDDYDDFADDSLKFGVRAGGGAGPTSLELTGDFTLVDPAYEGNDLLSLSAQRYRILVGARHHVPVGKAALFLRIAGGVDLAHATLTSDVFNTETSDTDPGIAAEVGAGIAIPVTGKIYLGGHFAIPMSFHFDEDDPDDNGDVFFDYTGVDIDVLFTIGTKQ